MKKIKISINLGEAFFEPMRFVECTVIADKYDFYCVWLGDHLLPWIHSQKKSAFVWSVMPSAIDRSHRVKVGPVVTSPIGGRYHPLIIGQAVATIDNMYPGRFLLGVGSGEAMSEGLFFPERWPKWQERIDRLAEAVTLMRKMFTSEDYFSYEGNYFKIKNFFLYTKPKTQIPIYFAAQGRKAASYAGVYGDHLVTVNSLKKCQETIFPVFEESAKKVEKDVSQMEKMVEILLYFDDKKQGPQNVRKSGEAGFFAPRSFDMTDPREIEEMSTAVTDDTILANFCFVSTAADIIDIIDKYWKIGSTHVELVTQAFPERIEMIGEKVLPYFLENEEYTY